MPAVYLYSTMLEMRNYLLVWETVDFLATRTGSVAAHKESRLVITSPWENNVGLRQMVHGSHDDLELDCQTSAVDDEAA